MIRHILIIIGISIFGLTMSAASCTKVVTYGIDHQTQAVTNTYSSNISTALENSKLAVESLGYKILTVDEGRNKITTGWQPSTSDSHYFPLFGRKDYSANQGSYYQLIVDVVEDGSQVKVSVSTKIKSIAAKLSSSKVLEQKVLARIDNFMRSPQIEMTNVGVTER